MLEEKHSYIIIPEGMLCFPLLFDNSNLTKSKIDKVANECYDKRLEMPEL